MSQIQIDFSKGISTLSSSLVGHVGEHKATQLSIIPPKDMSNNSNVSEYVAIFRTIEGIIESDSFSKNEEIIIPLCEQLTVSENLYFQLEAHDDNGDLIVKSDVLHLRFKNSLIGNAVKFNPENSSDVKIFQMVDVVVETDTTEEYILSISDKNGTFKTPNLKGRTGIVFVPSVDDDGNLSWNNDGGLKNPDTINIKGKGIDITEVNINDLGELIIKFSDGNLTNVGKVLGRTGVGIEKIEQTTTSTESNGLNIITITLTDGQQIDFSIHNGRSELTEADKIIIAEQAAALVDTSLLTVIGTGVLE